MRVAYISWAPFISGAERSLQTTLRVLPEVGIEPVVVCPPESKIISWCVANNVSHFTCPLAHRDKWHPFRWWNSLRQMRTILRDQRIDLIHSNQVWSYPAAGAAGKALGLPRVCHMRDEASPEAVRWCCSAGVEAVLCISRYMEQQMRGIWSNGNSPRWIGTLINPIVLPETFEGAESDKRKLEARRNLGVAPQTVVFGFIGQIAPVKGVLELLEAVAGLPSDMDWTLLVAGRDPHEGAPYECKCRERVHRIGLEPRVRFLGFLEDVAPFYHAIDVAVVPSLAEPLGRVPLEAAAYSRPTVAFAVGGLPETIQHGQTGWLVPPNDIESLKNMLAQSMKQLNPEMGSAARDWVQELSDPRTYVEKLNEIYLQAIGSSRFCSQEA